MRLLPLIVGCSLLGLPGCSPSPQPVEAPAPEREFVYLNGPLPRTIDPGLLTDSYGAFLAQNLFEGLTVWDAAAHAPEPGIAESWTVSDDHMEYTFKLRKDATWSDGSPVIADHFVKAWFRVLNPDTQAGYATLLYPIEGARDLHTGATTDPSVFGARAVDNYTLRVRLLAPVPYFLALTADAVMLPVNPDCLKKHGWAWTDPDNIVVNGPFTLVEQRPDGSMVLEKNPRYWNASTVGLERVVALTVPPEEGLVEAYRTGRLHWTGFAGDIADTSAWSTVEADPGYHSHASLVTGYLVFNTEREPFDDVLVRQALALALDRDAVAAPGNRSPTTHLVPEGLPGYETAEGLAHDAERARARLAEAGYPEGRGFPRVEIAVDDLPANVEAMEEVARQWRDTLDLDVEVYVREWRIHSSVVETGDFQVARGGWAADYPDASNFMEIFRSTNVLNAARFRDPVFDDFVREASLTMDAASHNRLLSSAERRLLEQAPIIPLYNSTSHCLLSPAIGGYQDNLLDVHLLQYLRWAD